MSGYIGLIGPTKAQKRLGELLEKSDRKVVKVVTRRLFDFKHGCAVIAQMASVDREMAHTMLRLWKADCLEKVEARDDLPAEIMSYWRNCLTVDYRNALAKIRGK